MRGEAKGRETFLCQHGGSSRSAKVALIEFGTDLRKLQL